MHDPYVYSNEGGRPGRRYGSADAAIVSDLLSEMLVGAIACDVGLSGPFPFVVFYSEHLNIRLRLLIGQETEEWRVSPEKLHGEATAVEVELLRLSHVYRKRVESVACSTGGALYINFETNVGLQLLGVGNVEPWELKEEGRGAEVGGFLAVADGDGGCSVWARLPPDETSEAKAGEQ